jgi:hypothetical protein
MALPSQLTGLLEPTLQSLGYKLGTTDGFDPKGKPFKYHVAQNGANSKPVSLIYVESLQDQECMYNVLLLGYLFQNNPNPLIIFSNGPFVHPAYNGAAEMWKKMGPEDVKLYSSYEVGLIDSAKDNTVEMQRRVKKYLGLSGDAAPVTTTLPPAPSKPEVVKIFISYSHEDKTYFDDKSLIGILRPLENQGAQFWSDEEIPTGAKWDEMIKERIKESHIALLLVSQFFLDSKYCSGVEIPGFIKKAEEEKRLTIFPIMLSSCMWEEHEWLASRQFIPNDGVIDVEYQDAGKRMKLFIEIRKKLLAEIQKIRDAGNGDGK